MSSARLDGAGSRLLVLTNETVSSPAPGMRDAYDALVATRELVAVEALSWQTETFDRVLDRLRDSSWDVLVVWNIRRFPRELWQMAQVARAVGGRPVVVWDGDHQASHRADVRLRRFWLPQAAIVFNNAASPDTTAFLRAGAAAVQFVLPGYDHVRFARAEIEPPPAASNRWVTLIGSNPRSAARVVVRPGALSRYQLAATLRREIGNDARIHGTNWPKSLNSFGRVEFDRQVSVLRDGAISTIYDHFPKVAAGLSNRLAISLLAGRPHVTCAHPSTEFLPGREVGLFVETSVGEIVSRVLELRSLPAAELHSLGRAAHAYAVARLSQRQMVRFMMSHLYSSVARVDQDPWRSMYSMPGLALP